MKKISLFLILIMFNMAFISAVKLPIESWNGFGINTYSRYTIPGYEVYWGDDYISEVGMDAKSIAKMYKPYYSLGKAWDNFPEGEKPDLTYYRIIYGQDPYANNRSAYLIIYFNYYDIQCWTFVDHIYDAEPVFVWVENVGDLPSRVAYDSLCNWDHCTEVLRTYAWYPGHFQHDKIESVYTQSSSYFPQGKQNFSNFVRPPLGDYFAELNIKNIDENAFNGTHIKLRVPYSCNTFDLEYTNGKEFIDDNYTLTSLTDENLTNWYGKSPGTGNACGDSDVTKCIFSYDISDPFHGLFFEAHNVCEPKFVEPILQSKDITITNSQNTLYIDNVQVNDTDGNPMNGLWGDRFRIVIIDKDYYPEFINNSDHAKYDLTINLNPDFEFEREYDLVLNVNDNRFGHDEDKIKAYIDNGPPRFLIDGQDTPSWVENIFLNLILQIHEKANCTHKLNLITNDSSNFNFTWEVYPEDNFEYNISLDNLVDTLEGENYEFITTCEDDCDNKRINSIAFEVDACSLNLSTFNTSCLIDDSIVQYTIDNNNCRLQPHRNESIPKNKTYTFICDYDKDGFIGDISNINTTLKNVTLDKINNAYEFKENNETLLEFDFNLTEGKINLANLFIEKQNNESNYSYIIIKGLDLTSQNQTKTIYLDNILGGTGLCIKDEELTSISEISDACNGENETWVACSGNSEDYTCELVNNETQYKIFGLKHSGVKEQETYCGDGVCNGGEDYNTCSADCSAPVPPAPPSGGGGGGGSSSATKTPIPQINVTSNQTIGTTALINQTDDVPEDQIIEEEPKSFFRRIMDAYGAGDAGSVYIWGY